MSEGLTIQQAAAALGVTPRQVRRYIHEGKLSATIVDGKHGPTYVIPSLPPVIPGQKSRSRTVDRTADSAMAYVRELQRENMRLAHELGRASERVRALEDEVRLLTAPKSSVWRRLSRRFLPR